MQNAMFEALEKRALMSLTVDLRVAGAAVGAEKDAVVTHVGQTIQLEAWGVVTDGNGDITDDAMQSAMGSWLSSAGGAVLGNLSVARVAPFNYLGSQPGKVQDLDGDGDLDIGTNDPTSLGGPDYFNARSRFMTFGSELAPDGSGPQFKIADLAFTVTQILNGGATTEVNFRTRPLLSGPSGAVWIEDGTPYHGGINTYQAGDPVEFTVAPATISGSVFKDENGNGRWQEDDKGLEGWVVFDDLDGDGLLDAGESSTVTGADGSFNLTVAAGTHTVRVVQQNGYTPSRKLPTAYTLTVAPGEEVGGPLFGQQPI